MKKRFQKKKYSIIEDNHDTKSEYITECMSIDKNTVKNSR